MVEQFALKRARRYGQLLYRSSLSKRIRARRGIGRWRVAGREGICNRLVEHLFTDLRCILLLGIASKLVACSDQSGQVPSSLAAVRTYHCGAALRKATLNQFDRRISSGVEIMKTLIEHVHPKLEAHTLASLPSEGEGGKNEYDEYFELLPNV
jgi:hypothetical protein